MENNEVEVADFAQIMCGTFEFQEHGLLGTRLFGLFRDADGRIVTSFSEAHLLLRQVDVQTHQPVPLVLPVAANRALRSGPGPAGGSIRQAYLGRALFRENQIDGCCCDDPRHQGRLTSTANRGQNACIQIAGGRIDQLSAARRAPQPDLGRCRRRRHAFVPTAVNSPAITPCNNKFIR